MVQKTLAISADVLIVRSSGGTNLGAGAGSHLVAGLYSGYVFRSLLKFNLDFTGVAKLTSATLYLKNSDQNHIAYGSSPKFDIFQNTAAWSEGSVSCESGYSASNSVVYPGPACTLRNTSATLSETQNAWVSIAINELMEQWLPATSQRRDGSPGGGAANHGMTIRSYNEGSTSQTLEWWSRSTSYDPYIVLVYESNQAPNTPTGTTPTGKLASTVTAPVIAFSTTDPDSGDTASGYDLQVATASDFASGLVWNIASQTTGLTAATFAVSRAYGGTALVGGTTYYWRGRIKDAAGVYSGWSTTKSFSLNRPPTISALPNGGANGTLAVHNMADLVNTLTPKAEVPFTMTDADGDGIVEYQVEVGGTIETVAGSWASGTAILHKSTKVLTNGTATTLRMRAKDSMEYGPWSTIQNFKVWYAQSVVEWLVPAGSSGWTVTTPGTNAGRFQLLYRSATGPNGAGFGVWRTSLPSSGTYFNIMVRTCSLLGTAPARPQVGSIKIDFTTSATPPYSWAFSGTALAGQTIWATDPNTRRYGINSLKCDLDAAATSGQSLYATQTIAVSPDQDYVFSAWVKGANLTPGGGSVYLYVQTPTGSVTLKAVNLLAFSAITSDWQRVVMTISADELQGNASVRVILLVGRTGIPSGVIWWDAAMMSEGAVAATWQPALIGVPAIIDANGIQIDASNGGILQLTGSAGGARDTVDLGTKGLLFGGDVEVYSESPGWLRLKSSAAANEAIIVESADASRSAAFYLRRGGEGNYRWYVVDGVMNWGDGTASVDTSLYRGGASILKTDDQMQAASFLTTIPIVRQYTASGTWTKPANCTHVMVECVGGGGAGGGAPANGVAGQHTKGGGGGAGAYSRTIFAASALAATVAYVVGAGGTAVSGAAGNNGGASSFGSTLVTAPGGLGGQNSNTSAVTYSGAAGGNGGAAGTGTLAVRGNQGSNGYGSVGLAMSGDGGSGPWGGGGPSVSNASQPVSIAGVAGDPGSGSGGSGGICGGAAAAVAGGAGGGGLVVVTEYYAS